MTHRKLAGREENHQREADLATTLLTVELDRQPETIRISEAVAPDTASRGKLGRVAPPGVKCEY